MASLMDSNFIRLRQPLAVIDSLLIGHFVRNLRQFRS